ncbi:hypothetical protein DSO57_1008929 [Entomophthora muscae]|uniref:Uncharacterized protein n=1 Tax=Entomophthora muscae TaxID=34485 RepID=A0ACC2T6Y7_9FUNG|nr:hypothetical protein DSO57_1008929 [Entomophthora muscae]
MRPYNRLSSAAQNSVPNPGLLFNTFCYLTQIPIILTTLVQLSWIGPYTEDLSFFPESGTDESPFWTCTTPNLQQSQVTPSPPRTKFLLWVQISIPPGIVLCGCLLVLWLWAWISIFLPFLSRPLLGGLFKKPFQSCTGWHPGGWFHQDGSQTLALIFATKIASLPAKVSNGIEDSVTNVKLWALSPN